MESISLSTSVDKWQIQMESHLNNPKLYCCRYFLLVYPSSADAAHPARRDAAGASVTETDARASADCWSRRLKVSVVYLASFEPILFLEKVGEENRPTRILSGSGVIGYIWNAPWLGFKEWTPSL